MNPSNAAKALGRLGGNARAKLPAEELSRIGKLGAAASPMTKPRKKAKKGPKRPRGRPRKKGIDT